MDDTDLLIMYILLNRMLVWQQNEINIRQLRHIVYYVVNFFYITALFPFEQAVVLWLYKLSLSLNKSLAFMGSV